MSAAIGSAGALGAAEWSEEEVEDTVRPARAKEVANYYKAAALDLPLHPTTLARLLNVC